MEFRICEQLSLDELCEHFSLSRSSIQKLFQKEKGCGPMEFFNRMKIQRAKDMIRDGRKNLTEIAGFLSYSSLPYFSKQFKKATGMAPMKYASSVKGITQAVSYTHLQKHTGKSRRLFQILRSSSGFRFPRPSYRLHG